MNLLKKQKTTIVYLFFILLAVNAGLWYYYISKTAPVEVKQTVQTQCNVHGFRRAGYKYAKPLLMLDRECDDPFLNPIRDKVLAYLTDQKNQGNISSASVYFRLMDDGRNFNTSDEMYSPGSMMKIMTLITYLKSAEKNPQILNRRITYAQPYGGMPHQEIAAQQSAQLGKSYSVDELLSLMIRESDNNATVLLNSQIDGNIYNEVLKALNLPVPDPKQTDYPISAENMSRFFRLLYNASFLSPEMSDKALTLLTESNFKDGFMKYVAGKVMVAHKFGEKNTDGVFQLHEGGVFFTGNLDYCLIVMSKGKDQSKLETILADVSRLVYTELVTNYGISNRSRNNTNPQLADKLPETPVKPMANS
jgi:beta-lactamase class A